MSAIRTGHGAPRMNATATVPTAAPSVVAGRDWRRRGVAVVRLVERVVRARPVEERARDRFLDEDGRRRVVTRATYRQSEATQFSSRAAPASPDFSGWNWVALSGPFSTAATNGSPCSVRDTSPPVSCAA